MNSHTKQPLPWSVTGIPREIRDVARAAAAREGITVGDWLTRRILAGDGPKETSPRPENGADSLRDHADLAARLVRSEADTVAAIRRIEDVLRDLVQRLDATEQARKDPHQAMDASTAEINLATRDQAHAFALLVQRIDRIERGADADAFRDAVRGLHQGMSRLAEQIAKSANESGTAVAALTSTMNALAERQAATNGESERLELALTVRLDALDEHLRATEAGNTETGRRDADAVQAALHALTQRFDEAERKAHATLNGLQSHIAETKTHISAIRDNMTALASAAARPSIPNSSPSPAEIESVSVPRPAEAAMAAAPRQDYLALARRAVKASAHTVPNGSTAKFAGAGIAAVLLFTGGLILARNFFAYGEAAASPSQVAPTSVAWLREAADAGEPLAQYRLGALYETGKNVPRDLKLAAAWYLRAAKGGNRRAMHDIGLAYVNGTGVGQNYAEAARWFKAAADLGLVESQFNLAVLSERGLGMPASPARAYQWYAVAAAQGDAEAKRRLAVVAEQLEPSARNAAEASAKAFRAQVPAQAANEPPKVAD